MRSILRPLRGPRVAFAHPLDSSSTHDPQPINCTWLLCNYAICAGCSNGADQYHVRLQGSASFRFLCGSRRMGMRMIKSL